jgi:Na+/serine symporter
VRPSGGAYRGIRSGIPTILEGDGMDALDPYATVLAVLSVALLLIAAGVGKKQLVWKQRKPLPVRSRRRRS